MQVYVLRSDIDGRFYVGMTSAINKRIQDHNSGKTRSTKPYRPWTLIHLEDLPDREKARKREKYLKSGFGKQWLKEKYALHLED